MVQQLSAFYIVHVKLALMRAWQILWKFNWPKNICLLLSKWDISWNFIYMWKFVPLLNDIHVFDPSLSQEKPNFFHSYCMLSNRKVHKYLEWLLKILIRAIISCSWSSGWLYTWEKRAVGLYSFLLSREFKTQLASFLILPVTWRIETMDSTLLSLQLWTFVTGKS